MRSVLFAVVLLALLGIVLASVNVDVSVNVNNNRPSMMKRPLHKNSRLGTPFQAENPHFFPVVNAGSEDQQCTVAKGTCQSTSIECDGEFKRGLCSGLFRRCCIKKATPSPPRPPVPAPGDSARQTSDKADMHVDVNALRGKNRASPLQVSACLGRVAQAHAQDMSDKDFFDHTNKEGLSPFQRLDNAIARIPECRGINYSRAAENIAVAGSEKQAMDLLTKSSGHFKNMVNKELTFIGYGVAQATKGKFKGQWNFCQLFATF
jgi:uncharacterized protein YkwD